MPIKHMYKIFRDALPLRSINYTQKAEMTAKGITLYSQKCYGTDLSLSHTRRAGGYHTSPHKHDSEQFNVVVSGSIWFFVDDKGYFCRPGDIMRIPRNKRHWAWNTGSEDAVVMEAHSPPLTGNPEAIARSVGLLMPDEDLTASNHAANMHAEYDPAEIAAIEERALAEEGQVVKPV